MSKWLVWTLLELSTFLLLANFIFLWLSHSLRKKNQEVKAGAQQQEGSASGIGIDSEPKSYKGLAHYLDLQINFAAASLIPGKVNQHEINGLKIWGTVLKAERAILLNQTSENPKPILNKFLSDLLYALSAPKLQNTSADELNQNLEEMKAEFYQTTELLITKESLSKSQFSLNEDLRENIDRAKKRIKQLDIKKLEHKRLETEVFELTKKIKHLEKNQAESDRNFSEFNLQAPTVQRQDKQVRSTSFKQISGLSNLSERQKMVIDQLKIQIDKANKNNNSQGAVEAQRVAIAKMERMSEESQSLILQLDSELETSSLSISSLRQDISAKDAKLAEMERQLIQSNETAIGNLQTLSANKKETLISLRDDLNSALENMSTDSLIEQDKDTKMLERLLQESETCVTLLAQELETAEDTNHHLREKVEALMPDGKDSSSSLSKPLLEQRERNKGLALQTTELKEKLMNVASSKDYQELRVVYNKKSLECDRLQLAFSDLEMKYLGTLSN
ncbi:hypothetical protein M3I01_009935 [Marinomonas sp. RSW2]|uniref:Chromosome partition protein Smc n=1 Tax=Marinomonas maritima TaxID=2940935 RepID=A0ABT5WEI4_9GAMM|nr:hypothetical protein [Marinomonas maritima]MDE8603229.1 hypothetical protein [Marinomonas maritima]